MYSCFCEAIQEPEQVLNLDDGTWSKPAVKTTPEDLAAVPASGRPQKGMTPRGAPTARTGQLPNPTPYTLHSTPYTLHPKPCTLNPTP